MRYTAKMHCSDPRLNDHRDRHGVEVRNSRISVRNILVMGFAAFYGFLRKKNF